MSDAAERGIRRAISTQDAIERAEMIGTPQGLRNLFPTNFVRMRTKQLQLAQVQRKIMTNKKTPADHAQEQPASASGDPASTPQQRGGTQPQNRPGDPAYQPVLPERVPEPGPVEREGEQQQDSQTIGSQDVGDAQQVIGKDDTQQPWYVPPGGLDTPERRRAAQGIDPGPPPARPDYTGAGAVPVVVDQLLMAAETRDRDAIRAVPTRNEPPAVAQYKANLLQWLDDVDAYNAKATDANAQNGTDPDAEEHPKHPRKGTT